MTAWMRARVSSCTSGDWLMTRDTVFFDTPARRAMSLMVALRPGLIAAGLAGSGAFGVARTALFFLRFMARGIVRDLPAAWAGMSRDVPSDCCLCNRCHRSRDA